MSKSPPESDLLAAWRPHFSVETRRRGEEYAHAGRVDIREHDGERVSARVTGQHGRYEVRVDLGSQRVGDCSCTCLAFPTLGTCKHVWAVLVAALAGWRLAGEAGRDEDESDASRLRAWLIALERLEQGTPPEVAETEEEAPHRVDYVLLLDEKLATRATVLETRRAKPLARGGFGKSSPFALLAPRKGILLGPEDRRIAALLRGAPSALLDGLPRSRAETRYVLDEEQTRVLLPELCATGRLSWNAGGKSSVPLTLDPGPPWKACLTLTQAGPGTLQLRARLERGSERIEGSELRGLLPGDFVLLADRILPARLGRGHAWFLHTARTPPPPFPEKDAPGLLLELARREIDVEPGLGMESLVEARRPTPRLTLIAPSASESSWDEVRGQVEFDYGVGSVRASDRRPLLPTGRGVLRRYVEIENALLRPGLELGLRREDTDTLVLPLADLPRLVRELEALGWEVRGEGAKWRPLGTPRVSVKSDLDWFEIESHFDGMAPSEMPRLLAALRRGESAVRLSDGSTGILPDEWVARWRAALLLGETHGGKLRFQRSQAWFVDLLLREHVDQESERQWAEQRERLAAFRGIRPMREPAGFHGELRPYQREGLGWLDFLEQQRFGGCLADDMGLGKTIQVLAWLQARKERGGKTGPTLVVAPKSLTHNWLEEARRFTPALSTLEYVGTDRKRLREKLTERDLVLTTYGTARLDIDFLAEIDFDVVVLDEAQAIKNEASRTARSVRLLRAKHRLALSGTPIENHLGELWSLFEFLNPGLLGRSSTFQVLLDSPGVGGLEPDARALVSRVVRPFLLRRKKEEVLRDLPERTEQTLLCDMEPAQLQEYTELRAHFRSTLLEKKTDAELERDKLGILEMLLRLRQAACHPGLIDTARGDEPCAKFDALFPMLDEVLESGHKALVFSQFTSFLALLRRRLDAEGRAYGYLDGKTPTAQRAAEVARFQNEPERNLFLVSLKAGGVGLNLTAADYVFLLDPWWNPAVEAQAIGRSHRIGQERHVFAYRLVCRDTVEERVLELQERKRELASAILDNEGARVRDLTREDLERLLS